MLKNRKKEPPEVTRYCDNCYRYINNLLVLNCMNRLVGNISGKDFSRLLQTDKHRWQTWTCYRSLCTNNWKLRLVTTAVTVRHITTTTTTTTTFGRMFIMLSSWQGPCKSSASSSDDCRTASRDCRATLRPIRQTWAVNPPVDCYHLHRPLPFSITQTDTLYTSNIHRYTPNRYRASGSHRMAWWGHR